MRTLFHYLPVFHYEDTVGIANGGKSMRNDKGRSALHELGKRIANFPLGTGIDGLSCFVQNQHRR